MSYTNVLVDTLAKALREGSAACERRRLVAWAKSGKPICCGESGGQRWWPVLGRDWQNKTFSLSSYASTDPAELVVSGPHSRGISFTENLSRKIPGIDRATTLLKSMTVADVRVAVLKAYNA